MLSLSMQEDETPKVQGSPVDMAIDLTMDESDFQGFSDDDNKETRKHEDSAESEVEVEIPLPAINHFLSGFHEESYFVEPCPNLCHAGEDITAFFDRTIEARHEDDALRAVCAVVCWIRHRLADDDNRRLIARERFPIKSNIYEL